MVWVAVRVLRFDHGRHYMQHLKGMTAEAECHGKSKRVRGRSRGAGAAQPSDRQNETHLERFTA